MEIGNPFAIDQTWVVSNISLNMHGDEKKKVTIRLYSQGSRSVIRQQVTQEEYEAHYRDTWRLGRKIVMTMSWFDEMYPQQQATPVPPTSMSQVDINAGPQQMGQQIGGLRVGFGQVQNPEQQQ